MATVAAIGDLAPGPAPAAGATTTPWMFVVAAAHIPLVVSYYAELWSLPHYQFFPLAFLAAYVLFRRDHNGPTSAAAAVNYRSEAPLLVVGLTLLAAAIALDSPWPAVVAALINGAAWAVHRGGPAELRRTLPAGLMLFITLRPPLGIDDRLIKSLQHVTARSASAVLDLFGIAHALSGNVIEIPGRRLLVEEACSGVNSFFSAAACVLFYVLWNRRGWISSLLLFLSIPFWVVFSNTLRVVIVTTLRAKWDVAADEGLLHEALGLGVFLVAVGLIVSTERLLRFYAVLLERDVRAPPTAATAPSPRASTARSWRVAGYVAAALCLLQVPLVWARLGDAAQEWRLPPVADFDEEWVPQQVGPWHRTSYDSIERERNSPLGRHSQTWSLTGDQTRGVVSLDYPFLGWHELTECYEAQGWRAEQRSVVADPANADVAAVELRLRHEQTSRHALLLYALCTRDGAPYPVRTRGEFDEWLDRAADRWRSLTSFHVPSDLAGDERLTYQFQMLVESYAPLDEPRLEAARRTFFQLRRDAAAKLREDASKPAP